MVQSCASLTYQGQSMHSYCTQTMRVKKGRKAEDAKFVDYEGKVSLLPHTFGMNREVQAGKIEEGRRVNEALRSLVDGCGPLNLHSPGPNHDVRPSLVGLSISTTLVRTMRYLISNTTIGTFLH